MNLLRAQSIAEHSPAGTGLPSSSRMAISVEGSGRPMVPVKTAVWVGLQVAEGEVSAPLESKFGFHVVKVVNIVAARPLGWEEARADIRKKLVQRKQRERRALWVQRLRAASSIQVSRSGLGAFTRSSAHR